MDIMNSTPFEVLDQLADDTGEFLCFIAAIIDSGDIYDMDSGVSEDLVSQYYEFIKQWKSVRRYCESYHRAAALMEDNSGN